MHGRVARTTLSICQAQQQRHRAATSGPTSSSDVDTKRSSAQPAPSPPASRKPAPGGIQICRALAQGDRSLPLCAHPRIETFFPGPIAGPEIVLRPVPVRLSWEVGAIFPEQKRPKKRAKSDIFSTSPCADEFRRHRWGRVWRYASSGHQADEFRPVGSITNRTRYKGHDPKSDPGEHSPPGGGYPKLMRPAGRHPHVPHAQKKSPSEKC
jgi:hypothetical protein